MDLSLTAVMGFGGHSPELQGTMENRPRRHLTNSRPLTMSFMEFQDPVVIGTLPKIYLGEDYLERSGGVAFLVFHAAGALDLDPLHDLFVQAVGLLQVPATFQPPGGAVPFV